ncbi:MAG: cyclic beta 1-2 glucan synthetase, partial [Pseudomonadota bacterium]
FVGKGIYDVDIFEKALKNRFPENSILSHDLLEGCYLRSGLLSDVQLYEKYPSLYSTDVSRRHRWIRGDWQLLSWVLPTTLGPNGTHPKNTLSALSRWKIFDNLRRSVVPQSLLLLLIYGWIFSSSSGFWMEAVIALLIIPSVCASLFDLARKSEDISLWQHLVATAYAAGRHLTNTGFSLVSLPYEAFYSSHAIILALWRMLITHKNMLEWTPSHQLNPSDNTSLLSAYRNMWVSPTLVFSLIILFPAANGAAFVAALPLLLIWILSPAIVWQLGLPLTREIPVLAAEQIIFLRKLARKTWAFFESSVGPDDNWLPPDNIQEIPVAIVAHRTSPTNMGITLLANLTAYDFGYISVGQFIHRTENTIQTMTKLERYRGHFYNWYDTISLVPLEPRYISTVDSGNLSAHLLTLRAGLTALSDQPLVNPRLFEGLLDTLQILIDAAG